MVGNEIRTIELREHTRIVFVAYQRSDNGEKNAYRPQLAKVLIQKIPFHLDCLSQFSLKLGFSLALEFVKQVERLARAKRVYVYGIQFLAQCIAFGLASFDAGGKKRKIS